MAQKRFYTISQEPTNDQVAIIRKKAERDTLVEDEIIEALHEGRLAVAFMHQGEMFTVAQVMVFDERSRDASTELCYLGVAKKHDVDDFDESVGRRLAFSRAIDEGVTMDNISVFPTF